MGCRENNGLVEMCLYLGKEREGGQKERERVAEMRGTDRQAEK